MNKFLSVALHADRIRIRRKKLNSHLLRTADTWTDLGEHSPHWSVITDDAFRPNALTKNEELFWSSGYRDAELLCEALEKLGLDQRSFPSLSILELGCGVGRVTLPLMKIFGQVNALDISQSHLSILRKEFKKRASNGNLQTARIEKVQDIKKQPFSDIFYSILTLQHNSPPMQLMLIEMCIRRIKSGGSFFFQLATTIPDYHFSQNEYLSSSSREMEMHAVEIADVVSKLKSLNCRIESVLENDKTGKFYKSHTFVGKLK